MSKTIIELQKNLQCENCGLTLWNQTKTGNVTRCLDGEVHVYKHKNI